MGFVNSEDGYSIPTKQTGFVNSISHAPIIQQIAQAANSRCGRPKSKLDGEASNAGSPSSEKVAQAKAKAKGGARAKAGAVKAKTLALAKVSRPRMQTTN